jgi:hypothetical protein
LEQRSHETAGETAGETPGAGALLSAAPLAAARTAQFDVIYKLP